MTDYQYWSPQQIVKSSKYPFSMGQMRHLLLYRHRNGLQMPCEKSVNASFCEWISLSNGSSAKHPNHRHSEAKMQFHDFLVILESRTGKVPKKTGSGYIACCPGHEDENPSLSLSQSNDGKILLTCFAGCSIEDICASLNIQMSDLFEKPISQQEAKKTVYSYRDEKNKELYRKIRIEPGFDGRTKSFYSERTDENGTVLKNLKGCRKVLYRLPEVLKGISQNAQIFLVEGEKDVEKLSKYDLVATTSLESLKWMDEFTEILKEADVVILYDMDRTGLQRKDLLCEKLHNKVKRLKVVDLPGLQYQDSHGPDISDWLGMGHAISELLEIVSKTSDYSPFKISGAIRIVTLGEFLEMKIPKPEMLLSPFLPSQGLVMIYAKRGVGKTHVALGIACAVAQGGSFLKWNAPKPKKVLYIDGEMPAIAMQDRLRRIAATTDFDEEAKNRLHLITPDLIDGPMPDLSTQKGRAAIEPFVADCDLIIVDNISSLFRSGIENDAESWQPAQDWALSQRRYGKSILFIHHAGKGGQQRGTSKKEDALDTVICLKNPSGYRADQGANFEVIFEKTRHFAGPAALPFQVKLRVEEDGLWYWDISDIETDPTVMRTAELLKQGCTFKQIQEQTGLTKSQVESRKKKAQDLGILDEA